MNKIISSYRTILLFTIMLLLTFFGNHLLFAKSRTISGLVTSGDVNSPVIGGIRISIKNSSIETITDHYGSYKIEVPGDKTVLVYSYTGMITQEIVVGARSKIDVDLIKISNELINPVLAKKVNIILEPDANMINRNVAKVLKDRLQINSRVTVTISHKPELAEGLKIYIGLIKHSGRLFELCKIHNLTLPGNHKPAAEGYAVKMVIHNNKPVIIALGADNRGVLYVAGEILRQMESNEQTVKFNSFNVSTAPAYRFRGGDAYQGHTMRKYTHAREWTLDEWKQVILDYAFAGANCFKAEWSGGEKYDFIKSFGLMTIIGIRPNQMQSDYPKEWNAGGLHDWEWIGNNWICPSIPKAREAVLNQWSEKFTALGQHDILRFYSGDAGGCRDERCKPWGKTFVKLCEDISNIILKIYPKLNIQIANQDLTNEGDSAIFDYLSAKPRKWLYGISYGPGSNAMSWYFHRKLRDDLFEYPGNGWLNRYMAETLNNIPKEQKIVNFSDITHWISAQYHLENPERNIAKAYGRRTWHTRPKALYKIFQAIMPFSQGDIIYTEGYHDHFNQYLWYRLLWNPHLECKEVVREYCRIYFGEKATDLMTEAIFQLEKNFEIPLATNDGIDRYYSLVKEAERFILENLLEKNHLWRLHMQKAALDKYNQLKLQRELFQEKRISVILKQALKSDEYNLAINQSITILAELAETPMMAAYREEADLLGKESEQLFAVRNLGYSKLKQSLRDILGLSDILQEAKVSKSKKEQKKLVSTAIKTIQMKTDYGRVYW
jgi:CarboxypepD_reg-like domain